MIDDDRPARPRRSLLYVPASNARALEKAQGLSADGLIVDLEDSVAPEAKTEAREAAMAAARRGFGGCEVVIRCNRLDTPWGEADVAAAADAGPDGVLVPKVRSAAEVEAYLRLLDRAPERTRLWLMVETPEGVLNLRDIVAAGAGGRLEALVLGPNDLADELRLRGAGVRAALRPILSQMVLAARTAGLSALGGVYNAFGDDAGLKAECAEEAGFGFDGKTLIHPRQIDIANRAFSPSPEEIAWAKAVVAAFAVPDAAGKGAIRLDGRMIERMHLTNAERILALPAPAPNKKGWPGLG